MYQLSQIFWSIAGELFVAAVVGAVVMMWGWGKGEKRWNAVVGGTVVVASIFVMLNQSGWWEPPIKVQIHTWLDEVSFSVREMPIEAGTNLEFRFEVTVNMPVKPNPNILFYVMRAKDSGNRFIVMQTGYNTFGSFPELKTLNAKSSERINKQLQRDLALKGLEVYVEDQMNLRLQYVTPVSSLTQQEFMRGYENLVQGLIIVASDIGLALEK